MGRRNKKGRNASATLVTPAATPPKNESQKPKKLSDLIISQMEEGIIVTAMRNLSAPSTTHGKRGQGALADPLADDGFK